MLTIDKFDKKVFELLIDDSDKYLFAIDKDTKILDYSKNFSVYSKHYKYLKDLITYTHINDFLMAISSLTTEQPLKKLTTNFSFNKDDVEDIPSTFDVVMSLQGDMILVIADPKSALSHDDAKLYLNLVNDYAVKSRELTKTKIKLQKLNQELEEEVARQVSELRHKDELLMKQAKDAAMGEIIDSIAHQWKNPLNAINVYSQSIKLEYELFGNPEQEMIFKSLDGIEDQVHHLVETLDEFRSFFRPNIPKQEITIKSIMDSVAILMKDELIKNKIHFKFSGDIENKVSIIPNQFKHVIINLMSNSKDAFNDNDIENRVISIDAKQHDTHTILKMSDNAGGIPLDIIDKIFDANFTTKEMGKGTGIGLYLTKQIIDKMDGKIKAYNCSGGVCFEIEFKNQ